MKIGHVNFFITLLFITLLSFFNICVYIFTNLSYLFFSDNSIRNSWNTSNIEDSLLLNCIVNGKYQCPKCKKLFSKKNQMNYHYRHLCGKAPRFQCPYCNFVSKWSSAIYRHVRKHHPNEKVSLYKYF